MLHHRHGRGRQRQNDYQRTGRAPGRTVPRRQRLSPLGQCCQNDRRVCCANEDRAVWLAALASLIRNDLARDQGGVIACSALKKKYRDVLRVDPRRVRFVYLKGDYDTIWTRLQRREGHYMRAEMLRSQFDDLEEPAHAIQVSVAAEPDAIINSIMEKLMKKQYALGIMGLGVMGRSLALNFERHQLPVVGYDPKPHLPADFPSTVVDSPAALVAALDAPRVVLIVVPPGNRWIPPSPH